MVSLRKQCFFQGITISTNENIRVERDGRVEFQKCSFRNTTSKNPVISIEGEATFLECTVKGNEGNGIVVQGTGSSAALVKSHISGNQYAYGIKVFNGGRLLVQESHIYGNAWGVLIDEVSGQFDPAIGVMITGSEIYDNKLEGVVVGGLPDHEFLGSSSPVVVIRKNKIFHNGTLGIRAGLNINDIIVEENVIIENYLWGIRVENDSGGLYRHNEVCNNKMGGVMVSRRRPGKSPCVVEDNYIHDNCGPAFNEGLCLIEQFSFPPEFHSHFEKQAKFGADSVPAMAYDVPLPNSVSTIFKDNQCDGNNFGEKTFKETYLPCCFYCLRRDVELKRCERCMTARYCGEECQKIHWGTHKYLCKAIGEKNAVHVEVSMPIPSLRTSGPHYARSTPRDGSRFIVKVQTIEDSGRFSEIVDMALFVHKEQHPSKATIVVCDRSGQVNVQVSCKPQIYHLIMECGMMRKKMSLTKKLYCWATFNDGNTLQIFTHEFPPVQDW